MKKSPNYYDYLDSLTVEIEMLIKYGQEGAYWDIKREWYHNERGGREGEKKARADMLFDIICMANNLEFRDAYIIIGVDDKTNEIIGVGADANRRRTEQLVDFLRTQKFASGTYPVVHVETLNFGQELDVIVIQSNRSVPYCLETQYEYIAAGVVYAREGAINSPKDLGAKRGHVEQLWRRHFMIDATPMEYLLDALSRPEDWEQSPEDNIIEKAYLKQAPEYTIMREYEEDDFGENIPEFYCFTQTDTHPIYESIVIRYHQTVLVNYQCDALDGGRYTTPVPEWGILDIDGQYNSQRMTIYKYYIKGSLLWLVHRYCYNQNSQEARIAHDKFMKCIVVFESSNERIRFEGYVIRNKHILEERLSKDWSIYISSEVEEPRRSEYLRRLKIGMSLVEMLEEWRKNGEPIRHSREW